MITFKKISFVYILSLFVFLDLFAVSQETSFLRKDGSLATAYISTPENTESFPLVIYIDGSLVQSVKNNFTVLSFLFNQKNMGVIAIEKRGITKDNVDFKEFQAHDRFENRLEDYMQFVNELGSKVNNWNGQLIFIGSSEGGKIAPKLTLHFADKTLGTILIGSGGGLSFGEEIRFQIKQIGIENEIEFDEAELDRHIDEKFETILNNPSSLQTYYGNTYQWFASYLNYNLMEDLLRINTPILMIHGALDAHIPVESADLVKTNFNALGKENLTYYRFEDLGHSISKRPDIFLLMVEFSSQYFLIEAAAGS